MGTVDPSNNSFDTWLSGQHRRQTGDRIPVLQPFIQFLQEPDYELTELK
ncbi:MAG: hypothetical protein ACKPGT_19950 [Microcystis sp.]